MPRTLIWSDSQTDNGAYVVTKSDSRAEHSSLVQLQSASVDPRRSLPRVAPKLSGPNTPAGVLLAWGVGNPSANSDRNAQPTVRQNRDDLARLFHGRDVYSDIQLAHFFVEFLQDYAHG